MCRASLLGDNSLNSPPASLLVVMFYRPACAATICTSREPSLVLQTTGSLLIIAQSGKKYNGRHKHLKVRPLKGLRAGEAAAFGQVRLTRQIRPKL